MADLRCVGHQQRVNLEQRAPIPNQKDGRKKEKSRDGKNEKLEKVLKRVRMDFHG